MDITPTRTLTLKTDLRYSENNYIAFRSESNRLKYLNSLTAEIKGYYLIAGTDYTCRENLHMRMAERGYAPLSRANHHKHNIFYVYLGILDVHEIDYYETMPTILINSVKRKYHDHLTKRIATYNLYPNIVPATLVNASTKFPGGVQMLRQLVPSPLETAHIITSQEQLDLHKNKANLFMVKYIDPLLIKGRKHLYRVFIMIRTWAPPVMYGDFLCALAKAEYSTNYDDANAHNVSMRHSIGDVWWPEGDPDPRIPAGLRDIAKPVVSKFSETVLQPSPTSKYAYHLIGIDVLFDTNYTPHLIDISACPMLASINTQNSSRSELIFNWEFEHGVAPIMAMRKRPAYISQVLADMFTGQTAERYRELEKNGRVGEYRIKSASDGFHLTMAEHGYFPTKTTGKVFLASEGPAILVDSLPGDIKIQLKPRISEPIARGYVMQRSWDIPVSMSDHIINPVLKEAVAQLQGIIKPIDADYGFRVIELDIAGKNITAARTVLNPHKSIWQWVFENGILPIINRM